MSFIYLFITSAVWRLVVCASIETTTLSTTRSNFISHSNCSQIKEIFVFKNVTSQIPSLPVRGSGICGEGLSCCSSDMEDSLKQTVTKDLYRLLHHNFHSVHGILASTSSKLQDQLRRISETNENKTMIVFWEVYKRMWSLVKEPISELYGSLWSQLEKAGTRRGRPSTDDPENDLEAVVNKFFSDMFPLVYHQAIHYFSPSDFDPGYKACLKENVHVIKPFGTYPEIMASAVIKSFGTTQVLLEALSLGVEVLSATDSLLSSKTDNTESCREALLRLYYCPKCMGLPASLKPCNGYCLNVMRGCLTQQRATELDLPWSNFLIETQKLVKEIRAERFPSIDKVYESLPATISDAVMYSTMNGPTIEKQVKKFCGQPTMTDKTSTAMPAESPSSSVPEIHSPPSATSSSTSSASSEEMTVTVSSEDKWRVSEYSVQLDAFAQSIDASKASGFYANLAEALCSDDSFAETRDTADCWNGHRVGEYTKALVRPGLDAQKYNPELKWSPSSPEPRIEELSEKLRQMRQALTSRMGGRLGGVNRWRPESDSLIRDDGSGSGDGASGIYSKAYDDEDAYGGEGSGSGDGPAGTGIEPDGDNTLAKTRGGDNNWSLSEPASPPSPGSSSSATTSTLLLILSVSLARWYH